ncbi:MAG: glycosyltransferase [Flavobacteriaceae bacterium]|nr:glycosyltransferase [Flavobacteriaceae bacterium]
MEDKRALIIFTRNPELGKVKTRLAATLGDQAALDIYTFLLRHTVAITKNVKADAFVFYSEAIREDDLWPSEIFNKKLQHGTNLGERMKNAFNAIFNLGYQSAVIIGSDLFDLNTSEIDEAFTMLRDNDVVIGPAQDGGYYLLGLKKTIPALFKDKEWGTDTVLKDTLESANGATVAQLALKNDIDYYSDIKDIPELQHLLPNHLDSTF